MLVKSIFFISLIGVSFVTSAGSLKLTYADCEKIFLNKNLDIKLSEHALNQSEHDKSLSYSGFLPSLSLYSSMTDKSISSDSPNKRIYSTSLDLTQNLFSGFQDLHKVQSANIDLQKAKNNLENEKKKQLMELKNSFSSLSLAQRMYEFATRNIKTRQNIKDLVDLKFSSGSETKDSVMFAEGQLEESKLDLISASHEIKSAQRKLRMVLGLDTEDEIEVTGSMPTSSIPATLDFKAASLNTLDFKNATLDQKLNLEQIKINKGKFLPSVDLSISRERENKRDYGESAYGRNFYTVVELKMTIPLFDDYSNYHELKKTEIEKERSSLTIEKTYNDIFAQLKSIHEKNEELESRKIIYIRYLEAAKMREEINTSKYRLGLIRFDTWIDSQNDLINYEKNVIQIDSEIEANLTKWESLVLN